MKLSQSMPRSPYGCRSRPQSTKSAVAAADALYGSTVPRPILMSFSLRSTRSCFALALNSGVTTNVRPTNGSALKYAPRPFAFSSRKPPAAWLKCNH